MLWEVKLLLSVFTASHRTRFLDDCYESLLKQSYGDWEWVVLVNGGGSAWRPPVDDTRVRVLRNGKVRGVGAAKRAACAMAGGAVLVELDRNDRLSLNCLELASEAFAADAGLVFVCSDWETYRQRWRPLAMTASTRRWVGATTR